ncbi:MAG: DUF3866 family protein [Actinomycetota bacterium]
MIRLRYGEVVELLDERPGAAEVSVRIEGRLAKAIVYPDLVGPVRPGDRILVNTTAVSLGLGTGGMHFVIAVEGMAERDPPAPGHIMKARYLPQQVKVQSVEEEGSPHRSRMEDAGGLDGMPVVWCPLHSMLAAAVAGARAAGASRIAYVMTDGAALPAALSKQAATLRSEGLLASVISTGQAFGGDLDAVTVFTGLLAARHVVGADVAVVADGPGKVGTGTTWGASDVESAMALNAAAIIDGRPIAALRISFADPQAHHRVLSRHSITALGRVALVPVHVAVPALEEGPRREAMWNALRSANLEERHQLVEANGRPALDLLAELGIEPESMGRSVADDPEFFLAAGAAGVLAGRMSARDRAWGGDG